MNTVANLTLTGVGLNTLANLTGVGWIPYLAWQALLATNILFTFLPYSFISVLASVADTEPVPQDLYLFGPPGSKSGSNSTRYGSGSRSFYNQAKLVRKTLHSFCFVTSFWLFIFEKWCKCSFFSCNLEGYQDPEPESDPYPLLLFRRTDPRIRIRTKLS